jgi:galactokinase
MEDLKNIISYHKNKYPETGEIRVFSCPGRINIIGEHIDYNGGHVLPAAINRRIHFCISPNREGRFRFISSNFQDYYETPINEIDNHSNKQGKWWLYPLGSLKLLNRDWEGGYDMSFYSTIPIGAGMSSSAAITVVTLFGLNQITNAEMESSYLALLAQRVEREIIGVECGIMDQFIAIHGKKNKAIILDTRDLSYQYVEFGSNSTRFILVNSGIKHSLKESEYNVRRRECENALSIIKNAGINIKYLCELDNENFQELKKRLSQNEKNRTYHVITENQRTVEFYEKIKLTDLKSAGAILYESHWSLKDFYEVSIPEMDEMVEWTTDIDGVYGARMMGGGFGGCIISMVSLDAVEEFKDSMTERFIRRFGKKPEIYECTIEDGVKEIIP